MVEAEKESGWEIPINKKGERLCPSWKDKIKNIVSITNSLLKP